MQTINHICQNLDIETPGSFFEKRMDTCECLSKGDEVFNSSTREWEIAEKDYTCEICSFDYVGKVESFYDVLLGYHDLTLVDEGEGNYTVVPLDGKTWENAVSKIIGTINGVGYFYFGSVGEAIETSSCGSAQDFVLSHLHHIPDYYRVYEGGTASSYFERKYLR